MFIMFFLMPKLIALVKVQLGVSETYGKFKQCWACYINYASLVTNKMTVLWFKEIYNKT